MYCFSFDEDLLQEWNWSGKYPEQPEILKYLQHVADRFDLRSGIQFNTRVTAAHFNEERNRWEVETDQGDHVSAQFLITGIGCLSAGQIPDIPGRDAFEGESFHTGAWPHDGVDLAGKRVGVIGTGSSGVQSIPVIAQQAEHLTVFQRTPQFTVPARHHTVDRHYLDDVKQRYDEVWDVARHSIAGFPYEAATQSALEVTDEERQAVFEDRWALGGFRFNGSFTDIGINLEANATAADFIRDRIRETVEDPDTAERLTPYDHPLGSKRTLIDTNYFETYNRDNVELVDIRSAPIEEITHAGIRTAEAEYEHVEWIADLVEYSHEHGVEVVEANADAEEAWVVHVNELSEKTLFPLADSWYLGANIPGKPRVFMPYSGGVGNYRKKCDEVAAANYEASS